MKKDGIKIVTIGGGSSYTPELMEGFIKRYQELPIREIWLVDIPDGLEKVTIVTEMARRMWKAAGYPVEIHMTLNRREALQDADFVTTQFRVGLLNARIKDERIPFSYQMLGQETNGAGGIFKALRTIPVIEEIIADMRELCPDAWLINFTNPSGMVTEAVIRRMGWKKCIGLCNVPVNAMMKEPERIGLNREDLTFRFAGINHFHWHRVYNQYGQEITAELIPHINDKDKGTPANIHQTNFPVELFQSMALLPCGYHRYYTAYAEMLAHGLEEYAGEGTRAEQVKRTEAELFELYKDPNLNYKPEQLSKRGGAYYSDAACECISAIYNNKNTHMVVSTENRGAISCLPYDAIVEISALISASGAQPLTWGDFRPSARGWLQMMKAMEECVIEAAMTGDMGILREAFSLNPLIPNGRDAEQVLAELLVAHGKYLPRFSAEIRKLKAQGVLPKDPVALELLQQGL